VEEATPRSQQPTRQEKLRCSKGLRSMLATVLLLLPFVSAYAQDFFGQGPDLVYRDNGLPLIAYIGLDNTLRLLDCVTPDCRAASDPVVLDVQANANGAPARLALRNDGRPIIAYRGAGGQQLRVYDCADVGCESGVPRTLEQVLAQEIHIAVRPDGTPILAYGDSDPAVRSLKIYDCFDAGCEAGEVRVPPGLMGFVDGFTERGIAMKLRSDGLPLLSTLLDGGFVGTPDALVVYACSDSGCVDGSKNTRDAGAFGTALSIREDDTALIAYPRLTALGRSRMSFVSCITPDCDSSTGDDASDTASDFSLVLRDGDLGFLARLTPVGNELQAEDCADSSCTSSTLLANLDRTTGRFSRPGVTLTPNGFPIIFYGDTTETEDSRLRITVCGDAACTNSESYYILADSLFSDGFED
ncbi:MAG: hypothetical protein AAF709_05725, partial [Pseudomonadota bacterium]